MLLLYKFWGRPPGLARSELLNIVDELYRMANREIDKQGNFLESVAHHFGVTKLEKGARKIIKEWLRDQVEANEKIFTNKNHDSDSLSDSNLSNLPDKESQYSDDVLNDTTSPARNANFSYHNPFTFYQRFLKTEAEKFAPIAAIHMQQDNLLEKKHKKSSLKETLNIMVARWNKKRD
jgi:hypothetical protein